jgi:hypothetical protein
MRVNSSRDPKVRLQARCHALGSRVPTVAFKGASTVRVQAGQLAQRARADRFNSAPQPMQGMVASFMVGASLPLIYPYLILLV